MAAARKKTGFVYHQSYLLHDTGRDHPERADRLKGIVRHLKDTELLAQLVAIEPVPAAANRIRAVHTPGYIKEVEQTCRSGRTYLHSLDTVVSEHSYEAACLAAGGVLKAVDAVMGQDVDNVFCAVRPPGHHALKDTAMGFCLFNNVAIGARYLQERYSLSKILIVDWDVHHGNGTQDAFYRDPNVLYFSTHRYPFYPGSGSEDEKGGGKGAGYNINVPLPAGCGDSEYIKAFQDHLQSKAAAFDPDFVIVSAGFDAHKDDPLGGMNVTTEGFAEMTRIVKQIAQQCCHGRLVSVLEGGYDLAGLAQAVAAHIRALRE